MTRLTEDMLRTVDMFRRVGAAERQRILQVARVQRFTRGDQIFREGDPADTFLLILSGLVKVFKAAPGGKEIILEIFGPGDPLGTVAVYESRDLPASALALDDRECLAIGRADFFAMLEQHPALVRALLSGLTLRLIELTRRLAELTAGRVEARFARFFLKLATEIGKAGHGGTFVAIPLTRQELADLTGTTIETAIRTMSRWQKTTSCAPRKMASSSSIGKRSSRRRRGDAGPDATSPGLFMNRGRRRRPFAAKTRPGDGAIGCGWLRPLRCLRFSPRTACGAWPRFTNNP